MDEREADEDMKETGGGRMHDCWIEKGGCTFAIKLDCWC